jgi:hypothetical protein
MLLKILCRVEEDDGLDEDRKARGEGVGLGAGEKAWIE